MRVGLLIGGLGFGGTERQLVELALGLRSRGIEPFVLALSRRQTPLASLLRDRGVSVEAVPRYGPFDPFRAVEVRRFVGRHRIDLLHSASIHANPYGWLGTAGTDVALVVSNRNVGAAVAGPRHRVQRFVFRQAAAVVVNAEAVRADTLERFGVRPDRVHLIGNGVDLDRFGPSDTPAPGLPRVGTIGSLTEKKRPETFAALARSLRDSGVQATFLHVGDGPLGPSLRARFGDAVEYLPATTAPEDVLRTLTLFVLTSEREGLPNVVLEAMASGVPVVATAAGGTGEAISDGVTGRIVPVGDAEALRAAVRDALEDREARGQWAATARERIAREFGLDRMVDAHAALYAQLTVRGR